MRDPMPDPPRVRPESSLQGLWLKILVVVICIVMVAPSVIVVPMSFSGSRFLSFPPESLSLQWYREFFGTLEWRESAYQSLAAAVLTTLVATPLGVSAAYGLHQTEGRWAGLMRMALLLPIMIPAILIAAGVFFLYARMGLNNTLFGIVAAHTCLALPFVVISVTAGMRSYDMNQERVARSLGASRLTAFATVTLPQIKLSVISGAVFAFITSLDELMVALFVARGESSTLPRRMFASLRDEVDPTIAAISTILIGISMVLLVINVAAGARSAKQQG